MHINGHEVMSKAHSQKKKKKSKKSSVRHTRAVNRARSKAPIAPPPDEKIKDRFSEILQPAIEEQKDLFKQLGLRSRTLTLSVMVAIVISVIWRQLPGGGGEISRLLAFFRTIMGCLLKSESTSHFRAFTHFSANSQLKYTTIDHTSIAKKMARTRPTIAESKSLGERKVRKSLGC